MRRRRALNPIAAFERLLTRPEPNAARRLGLYRIGFAVFYLWVLFDYRHAVLADVPAHMRSSLLINLWNFTNPPPAFFTFLAFTLTAALVCLMLGLKTRLATAAVLVLGALYESYYVSLDFEHATVLLTALIPLFMLIAGGWGDAYALDTMLRRRSGQPQFDRADSRPRYVLPIHASLIILSALFVTGAVHKLMPQSPWFTQDNVFGHLMLERRSELAVKGGWLNPIAWAFLEHPFLDHFMRWFVVVFEGLFCLALVNRRLRGLLLSTALIFHAVNAIWLGVSFTPVMIVYGLFIDWESVRRAVASRLPRCCAALSRAVDAVPSGLLVTGTLAAALGLGLAWSLTRVPQELISLGGAVNFWTVWIPVLPLASAWFGYCGVGLLRQAWRGCFERAAV